MTTEIFKNLKELKKPTEVISLLNDNNILLKSLGKRKSEVSTQQNKNIQTNAQRAFDRLKNTANGKKQYLGYFDTDVDASKAYDAAAMRVRGNKAKMNFSTEDNIADDHVKFRIRDESSVI